MTLLERIDELIAETDRWRVTYRREGFGVDAAACSVRLTALREVRKLIEKHGKLG